MTVSGPELAEVGVSQHEPGTDDVSDTPAQPVSVAGKRRGKPKRSHRIWTIVLASVLSLVLVAGVGVTVLYFKLSGNITTENVFKGVDNRPEDAGPKGALSVLVMGIDTRAGEGNDVDGEAGADASDTTILLHVSEDRTRAYGVSIPRDSLVERPDCGENNEIPGASSAMWNAAFAVGGASCTVEQFELNTGVRVDESIIVDFNGFKGMVDAVGGVPMCIPYDIYDPMTKYTIKEGERELDGDDSLAFVRLRYIGTGSDIDRITRQQTFIASLVNKVVSKGMIARPDRVVRFLNAATKSLTVSEGLSDLTSLAGLGMSLNSVGLDQIQFLTVPNGPAASDSNRIEWTDEAPELWRKIARDKPLSEAFADRAIKADKSQIKGGDKGNSSESTDPSPGTSTASPLPDEDEPTPDEVAAANRMGLCA